MHFNPFSLEGTMRSRTGVIDQNGQILKSQSLKSGSKICSVRIKYASRFSQKLSKQTLLPASRVWSDQKTLQLIICTSRVSQIPGADVEKSECRVGSQPHCFRDFLSKKGCLCVSLPVRNRIAWVYIYTDLVLHTLGYQEKHTNVTGFK